MMNKLIRCLGLNTFLILVMAAAAGAGEGTGDKPNIIIILADDMGYGDCGVYNPASKIKTPHIDQLAKEGLRFTDAHAAASTCTPSRYGLLTGINPVRTGVLNTLLARGKPIIADNEKTIANLLRDHGYTTHMVGKWHLGFEMDMEGKKKRFDFSKPILGGPVDRGFDSFYGIAASAGSSPVCYFRDRGVPVLPTAKGSWTKHSGRGKRSTPQVDISPGLKMEDVSPELCAEAVKLIRDYAGSDQAQPFFLYYALTGPHQPWVPTQEFRGKSGLGDYGDFMMQLDDEVGQVHAALKETGLDQHTLLIFTSDNGPGPYATRLMAESGHAAAGGLRGQKAEIWEGGHREPFIVTWPGKTPAGSTSEAVINFTDVFATLAEMLGVDVAETYPSVKDSESFFAQLTNPAQERTRSAMVNGSYSVRDGDWKLTSKKRMKKAPPANMKTAQFGLYNLLTDLPETTDLSDQEPERVKALFQDLQEFGQQRKLK